MFRTLICFALAALGPAALTAQTGPAPVSLNLLSRTAVAGGGEGRTEIAAWDAAGRRLFVTNGTDLRIEVLDLGNPAAPRPLAPINLREFGGALTSVAVCSGTLAAAMPASPKTDPGRVRFFSLDGRPLGDVSVGGNPDMVVFTPDGRRLLVANEGEPSDDYTRDPVGSISVIDLDPGMTSLTARTAGFEHFNDRSAELTRQGMRVFGPRASLAQDVEPEYIAIAPDSKTAWVTLQENNAIAEINIDKAEIVRLIPLGYRDFSRPGAGFDPTPDDGVLKPGAWPVRGMYQPDAIAVFLHGGLPCLVTINEGDTRKYSGFNEEEKVGDLALAPELLAGYPDLAKKKQLGKLRVTTAAPDGRVTATDGRTLYSRLYAFGTRSFSIWSAQGRQLYDSGDAFERWIGPALAEAWRKAGLDPAAADQRSGHSGPEPEGVALGEIDGRRLAFIGLEKWNGIAIYDLTNPSLPVPAGFMLPVVRNVNGTAVIDDLAPEGLVFVPAAQSPDGKPLLIVSCEGTGTLCIYEVQTAFRPAVP